MVSEIEVRLDLKGKHNEERVKQHFSGANLVSVASLVHNYLCQFCISQPQSLMVDNGIFPAD